MLFVARALRSLRVGNHVEQQIALIIDFEVHPPAPRDSSLPDIARLIVLLGVQRGVAEVPHEKSYLFVSGELDRSCSVLVATPKALCEPGGPRAGYRRDLLREGRIRRPLSALVTARAVRNGPWTRPASTSASAS